jgi:RimJ/RimL family protein N-acetyltransferase
MEIKNDNLCIRYATAKDAKILYKWWNDEKIMQYAGFPSGWNISEEEIKNIILKEKNEPAGRWIIEIDNKPCGEMIYTNKENNVMELGIKMCDLTLKEKGYGAKVLKVFMKYLLETMDN